jgi:hypothetical protein
LSPERPARSCLSERVEAFPVRKSLCHGRSLFPGNAILRSRDSGLEKARHVLLIVSRDKAPTRKPASSALFARPRENLRLYGTAWWRRQSQSNQSHKSNSLLTGKNTGKYLIAAHCKLRVLLENAENTSTFCEIPCKMEQGIFGEKTGKAIFRTGNLSLIRDDMTLVGRFDPSWRSTNRGSL